MKPSWRFVAWLAVFVLLMAYASKDLDRIGYTACGWGNAAHAVSYERCVELRGATLHENTLAAKIGGLIDAFEVPLLLSLPVALYVWRGDLAEM